jgi:hypothetical protein
VVGAGDSLYYDTNTSLEIRNEGAAPARLLAVGNHVSHLQRRGDE